jgi:hypothetical protein
VRRTNLLVHDFYMAKSSGGVETKSMMDVQPFIRSSSPNGDAPVSFDGDIEHNDTALIFVPILSPRMKIRIPLLIPPLRLPIQALLRLLSLIDLRLTGPR